ncbi:putative eka-like protein [Erysiphe necator]|uniref:Putative eka-like protein n=1 Tax=Uncinula necator TaxID=52586 RepID=A0A0B1P7G7_UNCNE|nr:putative eka-like protein [Erysiphe necator]
MINSDHNFPSSPTPLRAGASDHLLSKSGRLHPSLLTIANAMQQLETERRERMGLAQEFLEIIDAWTKGKTGSKARQDQRQGLLLPLPKKPGGNRKETESNDSKEDKRIFLGLRPDHAWRKLSPLAIKRMITEKAGVAATAITELCSLRSGYAIECVSDALRDTILSFGKSLGDTDAIIEAASDWTSELVPNVPLSIRTLDSNVIVTSEMVANECLAVCGMLPIQLRPMKSSIGQFILAG